MYIITEFKMRVWFYLRNACKYAYETSMINTSLAAKGALAYRLQRRTACNAAPPAKSKMAARGPQNGGRGLERCLPLGFWAF